MPAPVDRPTASSGGLKTRTTTITATPTAAHLGGGITLPTLTTLNSQLSQKRARRRTRKIRRIGGRGPKKPTVSPKMNHGKRNLGERRTAPRPRNHFKMIASLLYLKIQRAVCMEIAQGCPTMISRRWPPRKRNPLLPQMIFLITSSRHFLTGSLKDWNRCTLHPFSH